jgi:hypothetical protein
VELDTSGMVVGDNAGLGLVSTPYAGIAVVKTAEGTSLQMFQGAAGGNRGGGGGGGRGRRGGAAAPGAPGAPTAGAAAAAPGSGAPVPTAPAVAAAPAAPAATPANPPIASLPNPPARIWLRVHCNFDTDRAVFSWSADGKTFTPFGTPFTTTFQLTTFQGVRPALFHFNTSGQPGGHADFDNYTVEEPRARGIEREIPVGKTVVFTSGADGSVLVNSTAISSIATNRPFPMINVGEGAFADAIMNAAKFQVIDLGLGRVALKTDFGGYVSVDGDTVVIKPLRDAPQPGPAETFQWVNLMRGDMMLMSLTNHRYLTTQPNTAGPVTVTALGASPARKSGAEFKWKQAD